MKVILKDNEDEEINVNLSILAKNYREMSDGEIAKSISSTIVFEKNGELVDKSEMDIQVKKRSKTYLASDTE